LAVCWDAPASSFENLTSGKPFTQFFELQIIWQGKR